MTISGLIKTSTVAVAGSVVLKQTVLMQGFYHSWKRCCVADEIGFVWISNTVDCWRRKVGFVKNCDRHLKYAAHQVPLHIQECLLLTLHQSVPKCHLTSSTTNLCVEHILFTRWKILKKDMSQTAMKISWLQTSECFIKCSHCWTPCTGKD